MVLDRAKQLDRNEMTQKQLLIAENKLNRGIF